MTSKKQSYPKCVCCGNERHRTEVKQALSVIGRLDKNEHHYFHQVKPYDYVTLKGLESDWACDECLNLGKAIPSQPEAQNYCWEPRLAYFDTQHECQSCHKPFIFGKEEKRFWFETLKFWIDSTPNHCAGCRKEMRALKKENNTLTAVLAKPEADMSMSELEEVVAIYTHWDKKEKAGYYKSLIRKRSK